MDNDTWLHKIRKRQHDLQSGNAFADSSAQARPRKRLHEAKLATSHTTRTTLRIPLPNHTGIDREKLKELLAMDLLQRQYTVDISHDVLLLGAPIPLSDAHVRDVNTKETCWRLDSESRALELLSYSDTSESHLSPSDIEDRLIFNEKTMILADLRPQYQDRELSYDFYCNKVPTLQGQSIFTSLLTPIIGSPRDPQAELVAIKSYTMETSLSDFVSLKHRLCRVNQLQHPNMVETIVAFLGNTDFSPTLNFVFPWALCNLRQLFLEPSLSYSSKIQATQLEALASALAYLHEVLGIAHRSIRPSNILIYHNPESSELVLKLASFSSSVDLRRTSKQYKIDPQLSWLSDTILANDVLTLGCVFVELVLFMLEGPRGVEALRRSTTPGEPGAWISDVCYIELRSGVLVVESQVFDWMMSFSMSSPFARSAFSIIEAMLHDVPEQRMTARQVCEAFIKYGSHHLSKLISHASARQLVDMFRGFLPAGLPLLPTTQPPRNNDQTAQNSGVSDVGNNARALDSIGSTEVELTEQRSKEIYLCVNRILVEVPETKMCPISNVHLLPDDEALFAKMREQLRSCNGWFKNMLSWKTCTRIKFIKFAIIKDRRVKALGFGRPIGHAEYEYTRSNHQAEDLEAYLDIIAEEVLWGIHNVGAGRDETHVTDEIPKKRNPPQLLEVRGTEAYGVQAMQGLSLRRVCWWSAVSYTLGLAFVVFWLSFVDKLDLQNAFMPVTFLAAILIGALATTQVLV